MTDKPVSVRDFAMSLPAEGSAVVLVMADAIKALTRQLGERDAENKLLREALMDISTNAGWKDRAVIAGIANAALGGDNGK